YHAPHGAPVSFPRSRSDPPDSPARLVAQRPAPRRRGVSFETAAQEAPEKLEAVWCCQPSGERATHPPVQIPTPDVVFAA
ncbi:MAG TPA: hypothetical protein VH988_24135, partial [Thermoanaerobaculia bacterium]|nr:hypothetical protein [Thermoanaerobaculia bacterium]